MDNTIKAIKEQQLHIALKSKDSKDFKQHMQDIEVIGNLTLVKIVLRGECKNEYKVF